MRQIKVLLADTQHLTAAGLKLWLEGHGYDVVGHARGKEDLCSLLHSHKPHLLIADYTTASGSLSIDDLQVAHQYSPETNVLILSADDDHHRILQVLKLDVKGYINKQSSQHEIMTAIQTVARGEKYFSQQALNIMLESSTRREKGESQELTEREKELLKLLAKGYSTQRAADEMHLSPHTIHTHRKNIIRKLNIKSPTQFVLHAFDMKLITMDL